jgi:hypothetical protein
MSQAPHFDLAGLGRDAVIHKIGYSVDKVIPKIPERPDEPASRWYDLYGGCLA